MGPGDWTVQHLSGHEYMVMRLTLLVHAGKCISRLLISLLFSTTVNPDETLSPRNTTAVFSYDLISTLNKNKTRKCHICYVCSI